MSTSKSSRNQQPKKPSTHIDTIWILLLLFLMLALLAAYLGYHGHWLVASLIGCVWLSLVYLACRANIFTIWGYHLRCAHAAMRQSRWAEVDRRIELARRRAENLSVQSYRRGLCCFFIADILRERSRYTEAEAIFLEALECLTHQPKPNKRALTACLNNLGICRYCLGRFADAEADYHRALEGVEGLRLSPDSLFAICLHNLARIYLEEGQWEKADRYLAEAEDIFRHAKKKDLAALILSAQAELAMIYGELADADALAREAFEKARKAPGDNRRARAAVLFCYAELSWRKGLLEDARRDAEEALLLQHELSDNEGPHVSRVYFILAQIALRDQNSGKAESLFRHGFELRARFGYPDTFAIHPHLRSYARLLHSLGKTEQAAGFERRTAIFEQDSSRHETTAAIQEVQTVLPARNEAIRPDNY